MLSIRPKIAELTFQVFGRTLHPELYEQKQTQRIQRNAYDARIDITNCGHVITWRGGGVTICEVAASTTQPLPKRRQLLQQPLKDMHNLAVQCHGGIRYRTKFQLETVQVDLFWAFQQAFQNGSSDGLLHRFDSSGRVAFGALSYVHVETRCRSMMVQAVHTFPDDQAIVKVESVFTLPET